MHKLTAVKTASKGIAIGKAYKVSRKELLPDSYQAECMDAEIKKYEEAVEQVAKEIEILAKTNTIFEAHVELVKDISLSEGVLDKIRSNAMNVQQALQATIEEFWTLFDSMEDEYMRERASDIKDIGKRLLLCLKGEKEDNFEQITEPVIVVAKELAPSDTAKFNLDYVLGFLTELGGVTSHVCIMARSAGLPAVVGIDRLMDHIESGDSIIMDAEEGVVFVNADQSELEHYQQLAEERKKKQLELEAVAELPAITQDGHRVRICANVGNVDDIKRALSFHTDGIGLFRSEFLYMENVKFPSEKEQYRVYQRGAELCPEEVIIRTLDIGGDKELSYFKFDSEENPFLGWRAIRVSLDLPEVFKTQLRAILQASAFGNVKIMFPMIISMEELFAAKELLEECKQELTAEGIEYNPNIQVGMMIETPASVLCAEELAKEVDFFSIGTNDLTQYMLAVDRGNEKISTMYNSLHPAVIRSIKRVIDAGHAAGIPVGMCGEFASDTKATKLLLGMGLDEFSISASESAEIKNIIRNSNYDDCKKLAEQVIKEYRSDKILELIQ